MLPWAGGSGPDQIEGAGEEDAGPREGSGAPPSLPFGLWRGDKKEGELRSAVADADGYVGLALLTVEAASAEGALASAPGAVPSVEVIRGR